MNKTNPNLLTSYNYCCLNSECNLCSKKFIVKKPEKAINQQELCEECFQPMKLLGENSYGGIVSKFGSGTSEQKKQMLLKRSSEHFKKSGLADRKRSLENQFDKEVGKK